MLRLDCVEARYGAIPVLRGISLEVGEGDLVALLGANGAGKTTTVRTITGLHKASRGEILFDGRKIARSAPAKIVGLGLAMVPERREVFPEMTVLENLEMGAYLRKDQVGVRRDLDRVYTLFPVLKERLGQMAGTLSGGEQQMLAIGRALMTNPRCLLLDEPTLGLAPLVVDEIFKTIKAINDGGTTILLIEQNAYRALELARYSYVLESGEIVAADTSENLQKDQRIQDSYLGVV
jgi:branched-chain amino acid transport system ATP-binding protein